MTLYQHYLFYILEDYTSNFGSLYLAHPLFKTIWPEVILFFGIILLIIILGLGYKNTSKTALLLRIKNFSYYILQITLICLMIPFLFAMYSTSTHFWSDLLLMFQSTYQITGHTQLFKIIVILIMLVIYQYIEVFLLSKHTNNAAELILLLHISVFLAFIIISSAHYAVLLLALEGFSLILYILTTIDRSHGGITASVKYFTFGTLGSVLLFWGVVHYYALFPNILYESVSIANDFAVLYNLDHITSSFNFAGTSIILGLLLKFGASPTHQWVSDVYAGSHLLITAVFATVVKLIIFIILCLVALQTEVDAMLFIFAICSLVIGSIVTIRQTEIKRFLAYSSISHVGFLLTGDLLASYIYMLTYICSSLLFFSVLLNLMQSGKELVYLSDLRLIKKSGLWNTLLLTISIASMAGLPPFSGFFGKFLIWSSLIEDIYLYNNYSSYALLIVSVTLTLITIFYYMRLIGYIYFSNDSEPICGVTFYKSSLVQPILAIFTAFWFFFQPKLVSFGVFISSATVFQFPLITY